MVIGMEFLIFPTKIRKRIIIELSPGIAAPIPLGLLLMANDLGIS